VYLYLYQAGEKKRGQAETVCQRHTGNGYSPLGRLGKHGIHETARYRGGFMCVPSPDSAGRLFCLRNFLRRMSVLAQW